MLAANASPHHLRWQNCLAVMTCPYALPASHTPLPDRLRHNTAQDAKIMSWWDYGYQVGGAEGASPDGNWCLSCPFKCCCWHVAPPPLEPASAEALCVLPRVVTAPTTTTLQQLSSRALAASTPCTARRSRPWATVLSLSTTTPGTTRTSPLSVGGGSPSMRLTGRRVSLPYSRGLSSDVVYWEALMAGVGGHRAWHRACALRPPYTPTHGPQFAFVDSRPAPWQLRLRPACSSMRRRAT